MHGAASIQTALKQQEVKNNSNNNTSNEETINAIVTKINNLSKKYGGLDTAITIDGALDNLEAAIVELQGE
jgi:hypothetical protein